MVAIGEDYLLHGLIVHCQDRNVLAKTALVGQEDCNGIIWNPCWVPTELLESICSDADTDGQ